MDYSKICWLVDKQIQETTSPFPSIPEVARNLGCRVYETSYVPFREFPDADIPFDRGECVITHGTIQFSRQIDKFYGLIWCPATYFNENVRSFSKFACHYGDWMLNSDYYMLPYNEFVRRGIKEPVFIKPESGMKEFTGKVITPYNFDYEINSMNSIERVNLESLCIIAPVKEIKAEFRYIISDKKVITGSEYRWDDNLTIKPVTNLICDTLAQKVADFEWQPDSVYVCDIALDGNDEPKIIELNAFSSSGLYACDTNRVVECISLAAWNEHEGNI